MANSGLPRFTGSLAKTKQLNRLADAIEHNGLTGARDNSLPVIHWVKIDSAAGFNPARGWYKTKSLNNGFQNVTHAAVVLADFGTASSAVDSWLVNPDEIVTASPLAADTIVPAIFAGIHQTSNLPIFLRIGGGSAPSSTQQYKITTGNAGGIVAAKTWDGTTLGSTAINIRVSGRTQVNEIISASTVSNISGANAQEIIRNPLFPVSLVKTSGSAGDKTTQCSFVYTVKDPSGTYTYATGQSPAFQRRSVGKYTQATKGTAYISDAGDVTLWECDEVPTTGGC